jgi:hypothetical protein
MKIVISLLIVITLFFTSCEKKEIVAPDCIKNLIKSYSGTPFRCETGAKVDQYQFQSQTVYVFDPGNCGADMQAPVYTLNCNLLGNLGGFIGNLLINNVPFDKNAIFQKTIWKN